MLTLKTRIKYEPTPKIQLNLGCGPHKKEGYIGVDIEDHGQEVVWDITKGIPFPNDSVDSIFSSHFIEHLDYRDMDNLFYELIRVCKNDAVIEIVCPHSESLEAYYSSHLSLWNEARFRAICYSFNKDPEHLEFSYCKKGPMEIQAVMSVIKDESTKEGR